MNATDARATIKAINRRLRTDRPFEGGMEYGVDYVTWCMCYPQMAATFSAAAETLVGKPGRYLPRFR